MRNTYRKFLFGEDFSTLGHTCSTSEVLSLCSIPKSNIYYLVPWESAGDWSSGIRSPKGETKQCFQLLASIWPTPGCSETLCRWEIPLSLSICLSFFSPSISKNINTFFWGERNTCPINNIPPPSICVLDPHPNLWQFYFHL